MLLTFAVAAFLAAPTDDFDYLEWILDQTHAPGRPIKEAAEVNPVEFAPDAATDVPEYLKMERSWQTGPFCGPVALYFLLRLQDVDVTFDEVCQSLSLSEKGESIADLEQAARHFGLPTRVVSIVPEDLDSAVTLPAIIHWEARGAQEEQRGHFDVLVHNTDGNFFIIDTSNCTLVAKKHKALLPKLSGYALVIDRQTQELVSSVLKVLLFGFLTVDAVLLSLVIRRRRCADKPAA